MPSRPRSVLVGVLFCLLAALSLPGLATAHGLGRHNRDARYRPGGGADLVCAQAGVPLGRQGQGGHGLSSLSESQLKELKAACEKLASASAAERKAVEAAAKTLHEALQVARTKLDEACPELTEHHGIGGWGELSSACKEALKDAGTAAHEAQEAFGKVLAEATKTFQSALSGFETEVKPILETLEKAAMQHEQWGGWPGLPGLRSVPGAGRFSG